MKHIVKKEFKIALLMIILILGTSLSPQAQIVSVQPVHFEGGFSMLTGFTGNEKKEDGHNQIQNVGSTNLVSDREASENQRLNNNNKVSVVECKVAYSVWSYNTDTQTHLHQGSYYSKLVSHKRRTSSVRN